MAHLKRFEVQRQRALCPSSAALSISATCSGRRPVPSWTWLRKDSDLRPIGYKPAILFAHFLPFSPTNLCLAEYPFQQFNSYVSLMRVG